MLQNIRQLFYFSGKHYRAVKFCRQSLEIHLKKGKEREAFEALLNWLRYGAADVTNSGNKPPQNDLKTI